MLCPYNTLKQIEIQSWVQQSGSESERPENGTTITTTVFSNMKCAGEECGAWHDGRCHYNDR